MATFKITNGSTENAVDISPERITQYINTPLVGQFLSGVQKHPRGIWILYLNCSDGYFNLIAKGLL